MRVDGEHRRSITLDDDGWGVRVIDQTVLPHRFRVARLETVDEAAEAIRHMVVRGAPLIGATAAYGMALAMRADPSDASLETAVARLRATRPTAVNLAWALDGARELLRGIPEAARTEAAYRFAGSVCEEDVARNRAIGEHGLALIQDLVGTLGGRRLNVLTHCNAGWLATVDWGTATAPIYQAHGRGHDLHVWVDETRPRLQGASLTAWELGQEEVPHSVIADSAAAHLMQRGDVDVVIVGTDRTTASGDVANKVGTYPLALAAADNGVPFYVAAPSPSIDWSLDDGALIPIEARDAEEVLHVRGVESGRLRTVRIAPPGAAALNVAFDVTPARLVTGLITERGVCPASREGLGGLFPERKAGAR
jgi:methylthioribose-1-phosphate isomerase